VKARTAPIATSIGTSSASDLAEPLGFEPLWGIEHHFTDYTMCPDVLQYQLIARAGVRPAAYANSFRLPI
jgi:hypothetical protein